MNRQEIAQGFAAKYLGILGREVQYLGEGSFAHVYSARDKVIKVTRDEHDAVLSHKLINKEYSNIVKTFSVNKINSPAEGEYLYIIVNERLETIKYGGLHSSIEEFIVGIRDSNTYFKDEQKVEVEFNKVYRDIACCHQGMPPRLELLFRFLPQFKNMMKELKDLEVRNIDCHAGNFGISNGVIKLFDVGYESSDGVLEGIKIVEL